MKVTWRFLFPLIFLVLGMFALGLWFGTMAGETTGFYEGEVVALEQVRLMRDRLDQAKAAVAEWEKMFRHETTASWYGPGFHGRKTASGEIYDQDALTAASLWLPFGSTWSVYCPMTDRTVFVRITDRGPYVYGRGIDLSKGAARALGFEEFGLARVVLMPAISKDANDDE